MADVEPRVEFGLSNVYYALWDSTTSEYGTPTAINGSVKLSLDPEGDSKTFYADNGAYYVFNSNSGYSGSLEIARGNKAMMKDCMGLVADDNDVLVEFSDVQPSEFALLFEVGTDADPVKFVYYNVKLSRAKNEHNTTTDSTDPDTTTFDLTAIPRSFAWGTGKKSATRAYIELTEKSKTKYDAFYTEVVVPTKVAA